jgi:hypothetical protein
MAGTKIPDKQVVKPKNRRHITRQDGPDWTWKRMDRCPTYGICKICMGSGPSGICTVRSADQKIVIPNALGQAVNTR